MHLTEPYVYAQMISGFEATKEGEAKNSWLTGTAAWNYVAITQFILGIRPDYDGLHIEPVFPRPWHGFTATREFRGVMYEISVERTGPGNSVIIEVDGQVLRGNKIPLPIKGTKVVKVMVKVT